MLRTHFAFELKTIKYTHRAQSFSRAINAGHVANGNSLHIAPVHKQNRNKSFEFPATATAVSGVNKKKKQNKKFRKVRKNIFRFRKQTKKKKLNTW